MKAKKLIALLLCLLTAFVLLAFSAAAEEKGPCGHDITNYEFVTYNQSCNYEGRREFTCKFTDEDGKVCGEIMPERTEIIPAHNYQQIYVGKVANCKESGLVTYFCSWCRELKTEITPPNQNNHTYDLWRVVSEPTCIAEGEKERKCVLCGEIETAVIPVDSTNHLEGDTWTTVKASSCYADGEEKTTCKWCHEEYTRVIPAHYDYASNPEVYQIVEGSEKEATCSRAYTARCICTKCGQTFAVTGETDPDKHDYSDETLWIYEGEKTCKEGKIIKLCKYDFSHTVEEAYPHDFSGTETIKTAPGCKVENGEKVLFEGKKEVKCLYCDAVEEITIPAAHSFGEWTVVSGSCEDGGTATRTCVCTQETENISFEAGTHLNYDVVEHRDATCDYYGWDEIKCRDADCGGTGRIYYEPLGHKPGQWEETVITTCDKSGVKERFCLVCGKSVDKKEVAQYNHSLIPLIKGYAPDCVNNGITDFSYCVLCAATFEQETIAALGHDFSEQSTPGEGAVRICHRCYQYEIGDITCKCLCHNSNGLAKTIWKIVTFFCKILGFNQECKCGMSHY